MKHLILILFLTFCTCCGTKKAIEKTPEEIAQIDSPKIKEKIIPPIPMPQKKPILIKVEVEPTSTQKSGDTVVDIQITEAFNHSGFKELLQKHVSDNGKVNYNGFKADRKLLNKYISSLGDSMPNESWTKEDKIAFWINAYNALTIDLILRNPGIKSIKDIDNPWGQRLWKLGEKWYNLEEIEHQILRKMKEPRIHFAIVCASISCPKLQNEAYTASKLEDQLTNAAKEFLADPTKNNLSKTKIKLSKIFNWFAKDFKQNQSLIDFLNKYSDIKIDQNASKSYKDYNWDLND